MRKNIVLENCIKRLYEDGPFVIRDYVVHFAYTNISLTPFETNDLSVPWNKTSVVSSAYLHLDL